MQPKGVQKGHNALRCFTPAELGSVDLEFSADEIWNELLYVSARSERLALPFLGNLTTDTVIRVAAKIV